MKTKADVAALMDRVFEECRGTRNIAHMEYAQRSAHDQDNALGNFERGGVEIAMPREKVWYVLAKKHWDGVTSWINGNRSQREDVRGRIKDLIVYLVLLWAMVDDSEETEGTRGLTQTPRTISGVDPVAVVNGLDRKGHLEPLP
jgi:hypothetical protein